MAASVQPGKAWQALEAHYQQISKVHLRQLFAEDPQRGEKMALEAEGLYFDYSKNRITAETLASALATRRRIGTCGSASTPCSAAKKST